MKPPNRHRWVVVAVLFSFMLLHQVDKLLIGPLTTPIMDTFGINEAQMGAVFTGALIVGAFMYPIWGILYDRFARAKLLALASLLWGLTTWLSAFAALTRGDPKTAAAGGARGALESHLMAFAAEQARTEGKVVEMAALR